MMGVWWFRSIACCDLHGDAYRNRSGFHLFDEPSFSGFEKQHDSIDLGGLSSTRKCTVLLFDCVRSGHAKDQSKPSSKIMDRSHDLEIMDGELPPDLLEQTYKQLDWVNRFLGNTSAIVGALRDDPLPVRRVLDIGCGYGGMLVEIRRRLGIDVAGVELNPPEQGSVPFPIIRANAICDHLPEADVAISALVAHHLSESDLVAMIQNVGRSCRRFVLLDLVRSMIPLALFRVLLAPFLSQVNAADGITSVRRAFTPEEMVALTRKALKGSPATFQHSVTLLRSRQIVDIRYR